MSLRTYQRIENGDASLDLAMLFKISKFLNIEIDDWLAKADPKLDSNILMIDDLRGYSLNQNHLNLISDFEKINTLDDAQDFSNGCSFVKLNDPSFLCMNTKKLQMIKYWKLRVLKKLPKLQRGILILTKL